MDYIVIYNAGREAARARQDREVPISVKHPVHSKYHPFYYVDARLGPHEGREWLRGYDSISPKSV